MEVTIKGNDYRIDKIDTFTKFELVCRGGSTLPALLHAGAAVFRNELAQKFLLRVKALSNDGAESAASTALQEFGIEELPDALDFAGDAIAPIFKAVSEMKAEDRNFIKDTLLGVVYRKQSDRWVKLVQSGGLMFEDIGDMGFLEILWAALSENFANFT